MRTFFTTVTAVLAVVAGSLLATGTAAATTPLSPAADSCLSYTLKVVNGQWVLVPSTTSTCTSTSTGTPGSTGGGATGGTSGTVTNNCVPVGSCTAVSLGVNGTAR